MDPNCHIYKANRMKWINWPWKLDTFIKYFVEYDMELYEKMTMDIKSTLKQFTFGSEEFLSKPPIKKPVSLPAIGGGTVCFYMEPNTWYDGMNIV